MERRKMERRGGGRRKEGGRMDEYMDGRMNYWKEGGDKGKKIG